MIEAHTPFIDARAGAFGGYYEAEALFLIQIGYELDEVVALRPIDADASEFAYDGSVPSFSMSVFDDDFEWFL